MPTIKFAKRHGLEFIDIDGNIITNDKRIKETRFVFVRSTKSLLILPLYRMRVRELTIGYPKTMVAWTKDTKGDIFR